MLSLLTKLPYSKQEDLNYRKGTRPIINQNEICMHFSQLHLCVLVMVFLMCLERAVHCAHGSPSILGLGKREGYVFNCDGRV